MPAGRLTPRRRGVAVLLVLLMLAMTLGLGYAAVRGQGTLLSIERNSQRRQSARQAAITGMTMALKKMQTSTWAGVDTTLSGTLDTGVRYEVTYTTGDPRLTASSSDYAELPYRVTLLSTGYVIGAANPQCVSTAQVRAVVRLVPRQLSSEPADWAEIRTHSLYQWTPGGAWINSPCRIEGTVRFQDRLELSQDIAWNDTVRSRFLSDLGAMRTQGIADWRPFPGTVELPSIRQDSLTLPLLGAMGTTTTNVAGKTVTQLTPPSLTTYKLYAGGKSYNVQPLASALQGVSLKADPATNPAGIFLRTGNLEVYDDVQIDGTVILLKNTDADVHFYGKRIRFSAVNLPPLDGDTAPVQLPAAMAGDDFQAYGDAQVVVEGFVTCVDDFLFDSGDQSLMQVTIRGGAVGRDIYIAPRWEWWFGGATWTTLYNSFRSQEWLPNGICYFPDWLNRAVGLKPAPKLLIAPPATPVRYHWQYANQPIYVPAAADGGLRWELLDWTERL